MGGIGEEAATEAEEHIIFGGISALSAYENIESLTKSSSKDEVGNQKAIVNALLSYARQKAIMTPTFELNEAVKDFKLVFGNSEDSVRKTINFYLAADRIYYEKNGYIPKLGSLVEAYFVSLDVYCKKLPKFLGGFRKMLPTTLDQLVTLLGPVHSLEGAYSSPAPKLKQEIQRPFAAAKSSSSQTSSRPKSFDIYFIEQNNRYGRLGLPNDGLVYLDSDDFKERRMPRCIVLGTYEFDQLNPFDYAMALNIISPTPNNLPEPLKKAFKYYENKGYCLTFVR